MTDKFDKQAQRHRPLERLRTILTLGRKNEAPDAGIDKVLEIVAISSPQ
jgi:hypothetical protein